MTCDNMRAYKNFLMAYGPNQADLARFFSNLNVVRSAVRKEHGGQ